jgi:glutathione S-transferase
MQLHGDTLWLSPYFFSAFVALEEKQATYEIAAVAMESGAQKSTHYGALSLTSRVPALVHGYFSVSESSAMVEYIEEVCPGRALLGTTPQARARARQIMSWIRSDATLALRLERSSHTLFYPLPIEPLSAAGTAARAKLIALCERLGVGSSASAMHVAGTEFTIADADLTFMAMRLAHHGDELTPAIRAYCMQHWARPSIRKFVAHDRGELQAYQY